ncbi:unnamed protein product [Phyllotreta striolata]|uniref:KANL2-like probable zinc-finger domain-containing protein n=1 Tax=Phyllotreta striolata TaxID=444603 RepID=A0A9N9XVH3_PHYSR|nr:unnamed protein product [Phyllotreta striolata]
MSVDDIIQNCYQQHWFSPGLEKFKLEDRSREEKIEITRHEFRRHIHQLIRSDVGATNIAFNHTENSINKYSAMTKSEKRTNGSGIVPPNMCEIKKCNRPALPCTKQCIMHIMFNSEQVLFEYCTAKFSDNTQCSTPVLDILYELPLCSEHARKRENYNLFQVEKPKKVKKKVKLSAMIRPQKRNKKKKKIIYKPDGITMSESILEACTKSSNSDIDDITADSSNLEVEDIQIVDQVLDLNGSGLQTQQHLLEENDISNVLNTIQVDEFSDFFAVNKNGEYEPSREEAEELEKALAAVDNDVKSLEKLSQSQGLLDSLLDENALAETLVQIPDMFHHNGYASCNSNSGQPTSYLLHVEQQSHS